METRYFGGLSRRRDAEVMKISPRTVMRDWNAVKAWPYRELRSTPDGPSHWKRLDSLLKSAISRPPQERDAFLASECADDQELEREVRSLLACQHEAGSFSNVWRLRPKPRPKPPTNRSSLPLAQWAIIV